MVYNQVNQVNPDSPYFDNANSKESANGVYWAKIGRTLAWISFGAGTLVFVVGLTSLLFHNHILQFDFKALNWIGSLNNKAADWMCIGGLSFSWIILTALILSSYQKKEQLQREKEFQKDCQTANALWKDEDVETKNLPYMPENSKVEDPTKLKKRFTSWRESQIKVKKQTTIRNEIF